MKTIAIIAGGDSSEVVVSLRSAAGLYSFIDKSQYQPYMVTIIGQQWEVKLSDTESLPIDKNDFSFILNGQKQRFDFAYITIHGTPGENGKLQGYFDLIRMPYSCCGVFAAALTFDKYACNHYLSGFGVHIARSIQLRKGEAVSDARVMEEIGLPCFIKPNTGGSSFATTKVKRIEDIQAAITTAFEESDHVIIESFLKGTEVTCGMYRTREVTRVFPLTEVVPANEFFDYNAKYNGEVQEITPARISEELTHRIQELTAMIYGLLGAKGIIRNDYIITEEGEIYLLEVNTTPGMTPTSFIPQQVRAAGLEMKEVMRDIIEDAF